MTAKQKTYRALRSFSYREKANSRDETHVTTGDLVTLPDRVRQVLEQRGDTLEEVTR